MSKTKDNFVWKIHVFYYLMILLAALPSVISIIYIQLFEREKLLEYAEKREERYFAS